MNDHYHTRFPSILIPKLQESPSYRIWEMEVAGLVRALMPTIRSMNLSRKIDWRMGISLIRSSQRPSLSVTTKGKARKTQTHRLHLLRGRNLFLLMTWMKCMVVYLMQTQLKRLNQFWPVLQPKPPAKQLVMSPQFGCSRIMKSITDLFIWFQTFHVSCST